MPQYNDFRRCVLREKTIFRNLISKEDLAKNKNAIPDYLDKHFKEKAERKREAKMMGTNYNAGEVNDLQTKIAEWDSKE